MKRLTCEMCGSTNLVKKDGLFECQDCGTKYSVEEAKKMMVEGTVDVKGTVAIDRSDEIENRMSNAINEYKAGNNDRAYTMFSEILNIEPDNARAIVFKALSDSWNSSIKTPKLGGASEEICRAIMIYRDKNDNEQKFSEACAEILTETEKVGRAMFQTLDNFKDNQTATYQEYMNKSDAAGKEAMANKKSNIYLAQSLNNQARQYLGMAIKIRQERDDAYAKGLYLTEEPLTKIATTMIKNVRNPEQVSSNFVSAMEHYICMYNSYPAVDNTERERNAALKFCGEVREAVQNREEREKEERIKKYWEAHPDEKQKLDAELNGIDTEISSIQQELDALLGEDECKLKALRKERTDQAVPAISERDKLNDEIRDLYTQRANLGLFKGKQKKEVAERISSVQAKLDQVEKEIASQKEELSARLDAQIKEMNDKATPLKARLQELKERKEPIETELTMDRPDAK